MSSMQRTVGRLVSLVLVTAMLALGFAGTANAAAQGAAKPRASATGGDRNAAPPIRGIDTTADFDAVITGLVYDTDGNLLDNIQVEAVSVDDPLAEPVATDLTYEYDNVGSHGAYRLPVPAGNYKIRFSSPEWVESPVYETQYYGGGAGDTVTVGAGETVTLGDVTLVRDTGVPVTGTVLDADGAPMAGVEVALVRLYGPSGYNGYNQVDWDVTDASGAYSFAAVNHLRTFSVIAYGSWTSTGDALGRPNAWLGDAPSQGTAQSFSLPAGDTGRALDAIHLRPGADVHGTVSQPDGAYLDAYADLMLQNPDGSYDYVDNAWVNDQDGTFSFGAVAKGATYTVAVYAYEYGDTVYLGDVRDLDQAETFTVTSGDTDVDVGPIDLGSTSSRVTGTMVDADGDPVGYSDLVVWQRLDDGSWQDLRYRNTDQNGAYAVRLEWGHTYTIEADPFQGTTPGVFLGDVATVDEATTFTTDADHPTLALDPIHVTRPEGKLVGRVVDADGPVAGAEVRLWQDYCGLGCWDWNDSATTNANGRYVFRDLAETATYTISAEKHAVGYEETFVGQTDAAATATSYAAPAAGETVTADDILLATAAGTVLGSIDTSDGVPLDGYTDLDLYQVVPDGIGGYELQYVDRAFTSDDRFVFTHVPAGTYAVQASYEDNNGSTPHGYLPSWRGGSRPTGPESAGVFVVDDAANPTTGIDVTLERGLELAGTVRGANGQPLANSYVSAYEWTAAGGTDFLSFLTSTHTDAAGRYSVRVPSNSDVSVQAYRDGYQYWYLGGGNPDTKTPENTLTAGTDDLALDVSMTPEWGALGGVAGQQAEYCLQHTTYDFTDDVTFDGLSLRLGPDGAIRETDAPWTDSPLAADTRDPALAPLAAGHYGGAYWGVSPDGDTLCAIWNNGYNAVFQTLLTKADGPGLDVTYNYDSVPYSYAGTAAGFTDGNGPTGTTVVFDGSDVDGGYADDNATTGLIHNSLGSGVPGRYQFHFDGFNPRLAAPVNTVEPSIIGTLEPGATLTALPGTWLVDGAASDALEYRYTWSHTTGTPVGDTYVVQPGDAGRRIFLEVRAWLPGHDYDTAYTRVRIPSGPPAAENTLAPSLSPDNPAVGDILTADTGEWTATDGTVDDLTFAYQWFRNGNRISHTGPTYVTREFDLRKQIEVHVVARRTGYASVAAAAAPVTVADKPMLEATTDPALTGLPRVGETLTVDPGAWASGGAPVTSTYKWTVGYQTRNADAGSDGTAYTLTGSDRGKLVTVTVTAAAEGFRKGTWTRTVGPVAASDASLVNLTVHVVDDETGDPVADASVWGCDTSEWDCFSSGHTNAGGDFTTQVVGGTEYYLSVDTADDTYRGVERYIDTLPTGDLTEEIRLIRPTPPPPNVSIPTAHGTNDGVPTVYWGEAQSFNVSGCAGVTSPTYTVTFSDGTATQTGPMTATPLSGGLATYHATIPAFYPAHGDTTISTNIPADCAPGTPVTTVHIYIDPSGTVTDQYGRPIDGATVTLSRSDVVGGPYVVVPDGSDVMSPANRTNPDTTDSVGFFQWDVVEGWYRVAATAPGCSEATTPPLQVNPPQVDLLIKLTCTAPGPSSTPAITGTPKVGSTLTTSTADWPSLFGVSVQWMRDGSPIAGATDTTYAVQPADRDHDLTVEHTADRPDFDQDPGRGAPVDFTATSAASAPVPALVGDAPVATTDATTSGSGKVDTQLVANAPVWNGSGVANAVQWLRDGVAIAGQTGPTYTVLPTDIGKVIKVRYTGTRNGFADGTSTSAGTTGLIGDAPPAAPGAAVTGTGKGG
jgi:protocatechuate 3,4-dioxygenase beta subunit